MYIVYLLSICHVWFETRLSLKTKLVQLCLRCIYDTSLCKGKFITSVCVFYTVQWICFPSSILGLGVVPTHNSSHIFVVGFAPKT